MSDEYDLTEAGLFTEVELLDFINAEREKSKTVEKIWITEKQAHHLTNSVHQIKPFVTGKKLVDYWNEPKNPFELKTIHGVEVGIE